MATIWKENSPNAWLQPSRFQELVKRQTFKWRRKLFPNEQVMRSNTFLYKC